MPKKNIMVTAVVMLVFMLEAVVGFGIIIFGTRAQPVKSDCIIVLGCRLYGTTPSYFLAARLEEACRLYREGYGKYLIVAGGQGPGEEIAEAEAMAAYLEARGIVPEHIIREDQSTSTMTNILYSKAKMEQLGLKKAVIVSNKYHLKRAALMAKKAGIDATFSGVYVRAFPYNELLGFLREIAALQKYYLWQS